MKAARGTRVQLLAVVLLLTSLLHSASPESASPESASRECAGDLAPKTKDAVDEACDFKTISASNYAVRPLHYTQWEMPTLITGCVPSTADAAAGTNAGKPKHPFAAPFDYSQRLLAGEYDDSIFTAGPSASAALFDGAGSTRLSLRSFREHMTSGDVLLDFKHMTPGVDRTALPIPGVPAVSTSTTDDGVAAEDAHWWNVISVGVEHSGFPLHEHGAAWLAVARGSKKWAVFPPSAYADAVRNRPLLETSQQWFEKRGGPRSIRDGGGYYCLQPAGTVLLLPEGWSHATVNAETSLAVGRQRKWHPKTRLNQAEPTIDPANPAASPIALLNAALALKAIALQQQSEAEAARFAQPAAGMLSLLSDGSQASSWAAWLASWFFGSSSESVGGGKGANSVADVNGIPAAARLRTLFALLDTVPSHRLGPLSLPNKHWGGAPGLPGAKRAALAAHDSLVTSLERGAPAAAVAVAFSHLGLWWTSIGGGAHGGAHGGGSVQAVAAALAAFRAAHEAASGAHGLVPPTALHLGAHLAEAGDCAAAAILLEETAAAYSSSSSSGNRSNPKGWVLSAGQQLEFENAKAQCHLP